MDERFRRAGAILGDAAMKKISESRVAVLGLGGVGSWCAEALCRSGVGTLYLLDQDTVSLSNVNRQLFALTSTLDLPKAEAAARYRPGKQDRPDGLPVRARDARYAA